MIALNSYGEDYTGGLYVRAGEHSEGHESIGRKYIRLEAGEAVMHQYDLEHGVEVHAGVGSNNGETTEKGYIESEGIRYSWIVWLQNKECKGEGHEDWHTVSEAAT